jgi:hypothetical protein
MKPTMYQRLKATNDRNGNPQRCYVFIFDNGTVSHVIDEEYAGKPKACNGLVELPSIDVAVSVYKAFVRSFRATESSNV